MEQPDLAGAEACGHLSRAGGREKRFNRRAGDAGHLAHNGGRGHRSAAALADLIDTLTLTGGRAAALQTGLVPAALVGGPHWLRVFGDGYFSYLGTLPLLAIIRDPDGAHSLGPWFAPVRLSGFRFAPPYLAANRGGRELRYPITGGFLVRGASGYIAFGQAPEGDQARIWVEVLEFWPRLGLGPLYILTEVVLHRLVTVSYMRRVVANVRG